MVEPTLAALPVAGEDYPADLVQLRAWFSSDSACLDYLDWLRWPDGFACPHCGSRDAGRDPKHRYRCRGCWKQVSVTSGTIFDRTRTPLTVWFEAAWLMTTDKGGVSAAHLQRVLPISSYQTAWTILAKYRSVMTQTSGGLLEGVVEIDEAFFGGPRPGSPGRGAKGKTLVAGAIETGGSGWGRARLAVIPDASATSLETFTQAHVATGATIVTDGWPSYPPALTGYVHEPINISATGRPAHESLPAVHRVFALAKRMIEGTYQGAGTAEHLQEYLDEFVFRFNRRHSRKRGLVFMRLLQRSVHADPMTYQNLVRVPVAKPVKPTGLSGPRSRPGTLDTTHEHLPWRRDTIVT
ncbi:IS1595 family transposase [Microbacterium sp.]|uniref:IS1595 family transposase n=1 Tax=Microbacterium sp. TaxID=51671 RepID=UPI0039E43AD9